MSAAAPPPAAATTTALAFGFPPTFTATTHLTTSFLPVLACFGSLHSTKSLLFQLNASTNFLAINFDPILLLAFLPLDVFFPLQLVLKYLPATSFREFLLLQENKKKTLNSSNLSLSCFQLNTSSQPSSNRSKFLNSHTLLLNFGFYKRRRMFFAAPFA